MRILRIIGKAAVAFYEELFFYLLAGLGHLVCWLLIIPGPFALAGIYTIGQRAVRGLGVKWRLIWEGIKEFGLRSLLLFAITLAGYATVATNLIFYNRPELSPFPESLAVWLTPLFVILGLIWTGIVFYAQAFLMELEEPTIRIVLRNSLFLTILRPITTLVLLIVSLVVIAISVLLPILVLAAPGFLSVLSLTAVRTLVTELSEQEAMLRSDVEVDDTEEEPQDNERQTDQASPGEDPLSATR